MNIKDQVIDFIKETLVFNVDFDLEDEDSLVDSQIVDSLGVMELVLFVEERYGINVQDDEIVPYNFDSIHNLVAYIDRKIPHECSVN